MKNPPNPKPTNIAETLGVRPKPLDQIRIVVTGENPKIEALFKEWAMCEGSE